VLLIGYGIESGTNIPYWIAKNSWGVVWGEAGFFKIERGVNMCEIAYCNALPKGTYPLFSKNIPQ